MARAVLSVGLITLAIVTGFWLSLPSSIPTITEIDYASITMSTTASDLKIELQAVSKSRVVITLSNSNPDHTLTLLKWDTPLDPRALDTGVLVLTDRDSGKVIPSPGLKLNRKLPPTREDFVELAPSSQVSEERELKGPWLPSAGQRVNVHAEGEYKALWSKSTAAVEQEALDTLDGDGCYRASFRSEAIELEI